ncbi:hypothetical protein EGW08_013214, partial [Elysia chlorotica]
YSHTNNSSREDDSSASSPRHDPDTTPLLVITRAPPGGGADPDSSPATVSIGAGNSAPGRGGANGGPIGHAPHPSVRRLGNVDTPTQSNSSLQYIDEEKSVSRKKASVTSSLVRNSSGEGGGYTICMNGRGGK